MNSIFIQVPRTNKMSFLPYLSLYGPCLRCRRNRPPVWILLSLYEHAIKIDLSEDFSHSISPYWRSIPHRRSTWRGCCERSTKRPPWIDQISQTGRWRCSDSQSQTQDSQVGSHIGVTQTMLPLTIGGACVFLCLAASSLTLILALFSLHFIMCRNDITARSTGKQEGVTEPELSEPRPLCLLRQ